MAVSWLSLSSRLLAQEVALSTETLAAREVEMLTPSRSASWMIPVMTALGGLGSSGLSAMAAPGPCLRPPSRPLRRPHLPHRHVSDPARFPSCSHVAPVITSFTFLWEGQLQTSGVLLTTITLVISEWSETYDGSYLCLWKAKLETQVDIS